MRLDHYLVEHGLTKTRSQASDLIRRGLVSVNDEIITKTGYEIIDQTVKCVTKSKFVSRAGEKLLQALLDFHIDLHDKIVIDIGSSTGGFTDCSLQHGAGFVYAYDVGYDQLDETLRINPNVEVHEQTNILDVTFPMHDVVLIDVSFTSIKPILKHLKGDESEIIALIKPQFEAGMMKFKQGVLKDIKKHQEILHDILTEANHLGFNLCGLAKSNLKGKTGNQEYILYINPKLKSLNIKDMIGRAL